MSKTTNESPELASALGKVYRRALPLLFVCYVIAYIDRTNISVAQLTMANSFPEFNKAVIGFGAGVFFFGYFLLEIPGTLIVERWSASKWICRIMVSWGIVAALTAFVTEPWHFYTIRFLLGLAEAGFFPGVIVYLTHWFPTRDRARALSIFLIASPIAMIVGNYVSGIMLEIGENGNPKLFGLMGWQCIFIFWGIPAVVMGIVVVFALTDRPGHAKWLSLGEREALERQLAIEHAAHHSIKHTSVIQGLLNPNVLMLAIAYFGVVTGNYGVEMFLPSILEDWYGLGSSTVTKLAMIPSCGVIVGQLVVGWSSDHFQERRWHAIAPIAIGACGLIFATLTQGNLVLTLVCFTVAAIGMKAYMPAFWALPNMFLTAAAAAGSIGLINSVGNLGGFLGPTVVGKVKMLTGSYDMGIYFLASTCLLSACVVFVMPVVHRRLLKLRSATSRWATAGVIIACVTLICLAGSAWVAEQLKPWGPASRALITSTSHGDRYLELLADSMDDWFDRKPKIRDALVFRLDEFQKACQKLIVGPPRQVAEASLQERLADSLRMCVASIDSLKKDLTSRDKNNDNRYRTSVVDGLRSADSIVRSAQQSIRELSSSETQ